MIFFNDHQERESYYVQHDGRIAQIAGISEDEFQEKYDGCWQQLNRDLYGGEFSEECKYGEEDEQY